LLLQLSLLLLLTNCWPLAPSWHTLPSLTSLTSAFTKGSHPSFIVHQHHHRRYCVTRRFLTTTTATTTSHFNTTATTTTATTTAINMPPHASAGLPLRSESPDIIDVFFENENEDRRWRCAVLGCGMMGQEHVSYMAGYGDYLRIDYLCDPHTPSLDKCLKVLADFYDQSSSGSNNSSGNASPTTNGTTTATTTTTPPPLPRLLYSEAELLQYAEHIDLLVIATPNYMHTDTLLRWSRYNVTILVEKPVAISWQQVQALQQCFLVDEVVDDETGKEDSDPTAWRLALLPAPRARIWVAMEYRFIPAIAKLLELIPSVLGDKSEGGGVTMCTIRENRFPFLHKIGAWNRNKDHTGDSLVEKWYVI